MKIKMKPIAAAVALLMASHAGATEYYLCAKPDTLNLPSGAIGAAQAGDTLAVPVWGYATGADATAACAAPISLPGPKLVTDGTLTIHLSNQLPEPTSIMIPGQKLPVDGAGNSAPTWNDGSTGPRTASNQRVRSFGNETAPGATGDYIWSALEGKGTLMYHSGTMPQKQVYMGLSGLATNDAAANEVYAGVGFDSEVELFFSDVDPAFNAAVAGGTLTTAIDRHPTWFMINGQPYTAGMPSLSAGAAGGNTLLRLAGMTTDTHVAVLQGLNMAIHGEDGRQYSWQDLGVGGATHPAPRTQYSAMLPPAKTKDAIVVAPAAGTFAVYDGNGYMSNPSDINDEAAGDSVGGMVRVLAFGTAAPPNTAPVADALSVSTLMDTAVAVTLSGSDADGDSLTFVLQSAPASGTLSGTEPNLTYTPDTGYVGPDSFTYLVNDGTVDSALATVTIDVAAANVAPVADGQTLATDEDLALAVTLTATDADGNGLTYTVQGGPANGVLSGTAPALTYTPNANFNGSDSFTFVANDGLVDSAPATIDITVNAVNDAPVADAQSLTTPEDTAIPVTLTGSDVEGDALSFAVQTQPANGSLSGTAPNLTYTPNANFNGSDSFTFVANDGLLDSVPATVDISVTPVPDAPTATDQSVTTDQGVGIPITLAGTDPDGDALSFTVVAGSGPANGVLNGTAPNLTYVPSTGFFGSDSFQFTVNDGTTDSAPGTVSITVNQVGSSALTFSFSTAGSGAVPGVAGPYDDADIYSVNVNTDETANVYSKLYDAVSDLGLPNNADIDGMSVVGNTIYVSFDATSVTVPGIGPVLDEDVVAYDTVSGTWSTYFQGATCGLAGSNAGDIDAISVSGGVLYFSTAGNVAVTGVPGTQFDDADVYTWSGGTSCGRALDVRGTGVPNILPGAADVDGLTVVGSTYYMSFRADTTVSGLGTVPDQAVVKYDGVSWTLVFTGPGQLDASNAQNVDAIDVQ